jgi:hypothetical protein
MIVESKVIRLYVMAWGVFLFGLIVALPFSWTKSEWRYVALAGFLISMGSFLFSIMMFSSVQKEIKARYPGTTNKQKRFLTILFYFARGIFVWVGIFIIAVFLAGKEMSKQDLVQIQGNISVIEIVGKNNPSLKIGFENNSNQYGIVTFKIPETKLQQIETELKPGDLVFILIEPKDKNVVNDPYVPLYAIKSETHEYFSLQEYNQSTSANKTSGLYLGILFGGFGLIYLLTGNIKRQEFKKETT